MEEGRGRKGRKQEGEGREEKGNTEREDLGTGHQRPISRGLLLLIVPTL